MDISKFVKVVSETFGNRKFLVESYKETGFIYVYCRSFFCDELNMFEELGYRFQQVLGSVKDDFCLELLFVPND